MTNIKQPQHEFFFTRQDGVAVYRGSTSEHPDYYLQMTDMSWWSCDSSGEEEREISEPTLDPTVFIYEQLENGNLQQAAEMSVGFSPSLLDELKEMGASDFQVAALASRMCLEVN